MKKTYSATEARKMFFKILAQVSKSDTPVRVTFEGHPNLILLSENEYEGLIETLEVMSDPQLMKDIEQGERDMKKGKGITLEEFKKKYGK
ncbi:hypothetical protein A2881_00380 [Candidatus Peribacteria bacterium RIFCSPHIGHO2_01_FULL_55_13]|nr:MAG: hypothetical protein A2881_00380 [Candidatus Peribacteria bacterium RIFCSPHIGHO2_01_FULL_55_13]OGJ65221.1 MAG: hypothetical protein A3F36_04125 [Candidatus Peribacteria bacterium RIFCSPHIGHO2_12_FULL_55_11]